MEVLQPSWRGRLLSTRKDGSGKKYMAMNGPKSLLYTPVKVMPDATYRITLELHKESGNGIAYCNIYGNRNFDFPHVKIVCEGKSWNTYDIDIQTKDFPKTVPLVFRIWRSPEGTGALLVRRIKVELLKHKESANEKPVLVGMTAGPAPKKIQKTITARREPQQDKIKNLKPLAPTPKEKKEDEEKPIPTQAKIAEPPPKIIPITVGKGGIKVSVLISIFNRIKFFERTLSTYAKQTLPKNEFELVVIDDRSTDNILGLCKKYAKDYGLQFQYILFDNKKGAIKPKAFTPALSNNIGIKHARGSVIAITGPETLQAEKNLEISWEMANKGYCIYGDIFRSSLEFVDEISKWDCRYASFSDIVKLPGAKADDSVTKGWWWYYIAVRKEHLIAIHGVDEQFMRGITGEDDNLALRMSHSGIPLRRAHDIVGIHQDHSRDDRKDLHSFRFNRKEWRKLRAVNSRLLHKWLKNKDPVANRDIDWGSENAIIKKEIF